MSTTTKTPAPLPSLADRFRVPYESGACVCDRVNSGTDDDCPRCHPRVKRPTWETFR